MAFSRVSSDQGVASCPEGGAPEFRRVIPIPRVQWQQLEADGLESFLLRHVTSTPPTPVILSGLAKDVALRAMIAGLHDELQHFLQQNHEVTVELLNYTSIRRKGVTNSLLRIEDDCGDASPASASVFSACLARTGLTALRFGRLGHVVVARGADALCEEEHLPEVSSLSNRARRR